MQYRITDTSILKINESSGTIQNISNDAVEISNSEDFTDSFILYPLNKCSFKEQLYIRAYGQAAQVIKINVAPFVVSGNGTSSTGENLKIATDNEVDGYFDDIFET